MKTLKLGLIGNTEVKLYQDIDETPIKLYNLFNEYALRDSEIGSTMADIDKRHITLATLIQKNKEEAMQSLNNMYQTYWGILNHLNFKQLCFGCMIHSIDGERITDYSEDSMRLMLDKLSNYGLTMKMVKEEIESLKKNFKNNSN